MTDILREFETRLLLAIRELGDDAFGLSIHEELESATGRELSLGQVYTGLSRLEQRGLVASAEGESTAGRGGRRRKYYRLEPEAVRLLETSAEAFRELAELIAGALPERAEGRS